MINKWLASGTPYIWLNAGAVALSVIMVVGLVLLIAIRGLGHFWPKPITTFEHFPKAGVSQIMLGEITEKETRFDKTGRVADIRYLIKIGNRDIFGYDFKWIAQTEMGAMSYPKDAVIIERREWGNFYGYLQAIYKDGVLGSGADVWQHLADLLKETSRLTSEIEELEKKQIGEVNYQLEKLRLALRYLEIKHIEDPSAVAKIKAEQATLKQHYQVYIEQLTTLYNELNRYQLKLRLADQKEVMVPMAKVIRLYQPNALTTIQKLQLYFERLWEFVSTDPREANTEGGIFPAIFGTVLMVMLMAIIVTPFGVVTAVYLREYARQNVLTRLIRIAVNNLAGVPSVVYGVFGLGFFVYFMGGTIDELFFSTALPTPTFGTPGLLWASLTLALLTVPTVIVSTEEGLSRVPIAIREGSLALGATKSETLWRTVIPMTVPAIITGMILAIARAAGEVAPLMLVGVVKLAPSLALDGNYPFLHLERKFMHLGFHIYDVGFQSPNVEVARPLVYATALLLVLIVISLNLTAIWIRNRLREKYRAAEQL